MAGRLLVRAAVVGALLSSSSPRIARAEDTEDEATEKHKKKKKKLTFGGRVFARSEIAKTDPETEWAGATSVDTARAGLDYRAKELRIRLSAEFAGKPRLKNAYAELRLLDGSERVSVRAGQFKMPMSAIELESRWALPMTDRGLLHTILASRYQITSRTVGAMVTGSVKCPLHARAQLGVFQGRDDAGDFLEATTSDRFGQDIVGRVEIEPAKGVAIGAAAQARVGALAVDVPAIIRRGRAGELDVTLDRKLGPGTARVWLESMIGTSWIAGRAMPCNGTRSCKALFVEGRGIAAYRIGGRAEKQRYVELYANGGVLDPDHDTANDLTLELGGGVTYGAWDRWRVSTSLDVWRFGDATPLGLVEFAAVPADSVRVLVQLGARL